MCDYCNSSEEWDRYHGESEVSEDWTTKERKSQLQEHIDRTNAQILEFEKDITAWKEQIAELDKQLLREYVKSKRAGDMFFFSVHNPAAYDPLYVAVFRYPGWLVMNSNGAPGKDLTIEQMVNLLVGKHINELDLGKVVDL